MKTKTITLSVEEWKQICDATSSYCDMGPETAGWQSRELEDASRALNAALAAAEESGNKQRDDSKP